MQGVDHFKTYYKALATYPGVNGRGTPQSSNPLLIFQSTGLIAAACTCKKAALSGTLQNKNIVVAHTFTRRQPETAEGLGTWAMEKGVAV